MADKQAFIDALKPHALAISAETGIAPELIISQAALETGWGRSAVGNNYFGVKSHGRKGGITANTHEFVNGTRVNTSDSFRQYAGIEESMRDYANFLKSNSRYKPVLSAKTLADQIREMGRSGYATDPLYGSKLSSIARDVSVGLGGNRAVPAIENASPRRAQPFDLIGHAFNGARNAAMGLVAQADQQKNKVLANPMNRIGIGLKMASAAQAAQPEGSRKVMVPGGDSVLKALMNPGIQSSQSVRDEARRTGNHSTLKRGDRRYNADTNKWEVK